MARGASPRSLGVTSLTCIYQATLPGYPTLCELLSRTEITRAAYNLSVRLLSLALGTEALMLLEYVVAVCRSYLPDDPATATYNLCLAQALRSLSQCLSTLGLVDEPLMAVEESVNILRGLRAEHRPAAPHFPIISLDDFRDMSEERRPDMINSSIGRSFVTLSHTLSRVGRPEDALTVVQEAVELFRGTVTGNACVPESDLIISLLRLSDCQSSLGQMDEAVDAALEAIRMYDKVGMGHTGWVMDNHAEALTKVAGRLREAGRHDEALETDIEGVKLYRTLAADRPTIFAKDLATSLQSVGTDLTNVGRHDEALDADTEALTLYRTLATDRPAVFTKDLASSLKQVGIDLTNLGRHDEALDADTEALKLYRTLATDRPAVFTEDLASSLQQVGVDLTNVGRHDEALDADTEAVNLCRTLAADRPQFSQRIWHHPSLRSESISHISVVTMKHWKLTTRQ
jgi:tetratricopeptide (TPR) repeat protein